MTIRKRSIAVGKAVLRRLPPIWSRRAMAAADRTGLTARLTSSTGSPVPGHVAVGAPRRRRALLTDLLRSGIDGDLVRADASERRLLDGGAMSPEERAAVCAARAFADYSARPSADSVSLVWWPRPFPGNFGDWLSPFIVAGYTDSRLTFQSPTSARLGTGRHLVAIGSIGRFIKSNSVVVGTGVSSDQHDLDPSARYVSVRGPLTAEHLRSCGGPTVTSFGDPAAVISRLFPLDRSRTNGRTAFVRHFTHRNLPVMVPSSWDELEVLVSRPDDIRAFLIALGAYDRVVTSAMHVLITCQSYGIPCALIDFEGQAGAIAGNGMKYTDYSRGVGFDALTPALVPLDLRQLDVVSATIDAKVPGSKLDEIEQALRDGLALAGR